MIKSVGILGKKNQASAGTIKLESENNPSNSMAVKSENILGHELNTRKIIRTDRKKKIRNMFNRIAYE